MKDLMITTMPIKPYEKINIGLILWLSIEKLVYYIRF